MIKYDGLVIHQHHDDEGVLEIVEHRGIRSLHFGSLPKQSSMSLLDPHALQLDYTRAMTCWLLFKPELTDEALLIGLGGGSLCKHLLYHFPKCRLRVIECRKSVIKIARSHFDLPLDPRLKIIIDDGGHYVCQRVETHAQRYSLVFVDAFDHHSMAPSVCNKEFFAAAKALLKDDGILIINLWGGFENPLFIECANWLGDIFNHNTLYLPVRNRSNIIGLVFNGADFNVSKEKLKLQAAELEYRYHIEFPVFLKNLQKYNTDTFNHLVKK